MAASPVLRDPKNPTAFFAPFLGSRMRPHLLAAGFGSAIVCLDFLTKLFATLAFEPPIIIWPGVLSLVLHHNTGIAFSIPVPLAAQIGLSLLLLAGLAWYWRSEARSLVESLALAAIFGGALGNLAERILFGSVTDFVAVWRFPVFNVADSAISLGVVALIFYELFKRPAAVLRPGS
jgi:signal peptidase II